jgi:putative transposase
MPNCRPGAYASEKKRVARLMKAAGLHGASRRKRPTATRCEPQAPDRVERDFSADRPDELWVADITYVPT